MNSGMATSGGSGTIFKYGYLRGMWVHYSMITSGGWGSSVGGLQMRLSL